MTALGGMVLPALVFLALNAGGPGERGWGVPMATDIAFAVGVLALFGSRVPSGLKVLLLSVAIVDDIGAIIVIAIFYTGGLAWSPLAIAVGLLVVIAVLYRMGVVWWPVHVLLGLGVWLATYASGVEATIAGVAVGLLTPAQRQVQETISPAERLTHTLHPWTSFVVVPLFALANAGVPLSRVALAAAVDSPITGGVILGLVVGKLVGVSGAAWLALRLRVGALPEAVTSRQLLALAAVAGVGFTVSLFIASLAYPTAELQDQARVGIMAGSLLAAVVGAMLLRASLPPRPRPAALQPRKEDGNRLGGPEGRGIGSGRAEGACRDCGVATVAATLGFAVVRPWGRPEAVVARDADRVVGAAGEPVPGLLRQLPRPGPCRRRAAGR